MLRQRPARVRLAPAVLVDVREVFCLGRYSRSPKARRRCASRARSSAALAPYLFNIVRDRQPNNLMASVSLPSFAIQTCAAV